MAEPIKKGDDPVIAAAKEQADARVSAADAAGDTAHELAELAGTPMVAINRATEDVLGRKLPDDPDKARAQQREAQAIRQSHVEVDVARVQRGLPPKYATE
jgi:hypothetical protein